MAPTERPSRFAAAEDAAAQGRFKRVLALEDAAGADRDKLLAAAYRAAIEHGQPRVAGEIMLLLAERGAASFKQLYNCMRVLLESDLRAPARKLVDAHRLQGDEAAVLAAMLDLHSGRFEEAARLATDVAPGSPVRAQAAALLREMHLLAGDPSASVDAGLEELALAPRLRVALAVLRTADTHGLRDPAIRALQVALATAETIAASAARSAADLEDLVHLALATFDFPGARMRVEQARREGLSEDILRKLTSSIGNMESDVAGFEADLAACHAHLMRQLASPSEAHAAQRPAGDFTVLVPTSFFVVERDESVAAFKRWQRRFLFTVMDELRVHGVKLDVRPHFGRGRRLEWSDGSRCLSYHTYGQAPGCFHFKEAELPHLFYLDRGGYSGWSELADARFNVDESLVAAEDALAFVRGERERLHAGNESKYGQAAFDPALQLPADYVLVAMQTVNDSVQEHAWIRTLEMAEMVVRRFAGTGTTVVVKRHPLCRDPRVSRRLKAWEREPGVVVSDASIHQLIPGARAVFTVNSGVGLEALLYEKPVYVSGRSDYSQVCHVFTTAQELRLKTRTIEAAVSSADLARFLHFYLRTYLVDARSAEGVRSAVRQRLLAGATLLVNKTQGGPKSPA